MTVLYYSEPTSIEVKVKTLKNLPYEDHNKRVKLPDDFKANKLIIAVLDREVHLLSFLGERAEKN